METWRHRRTAPCVISTRRCDWHCSNTDLPGTFPLRLMKRELWLVLPLVAAIGVPAFAHPVPFSYLDIVLSDRAADVTMVAHVFDMAHDLRINDSSRLLDRAFLAEHAADSVALLGPRFSIQADDH